MANNTISAGFLRVDTLNVISADASIISANNFDFQNLNVDGTLSVTGNVSLGNSVTLGGVQIATLNNLSEGLNDKASIDALNTGLSDKITLAQLDNRLALKANNTELDLKANVTDLSGYATKDYVQSVVSNAQIQSVDLSEYVTTADLQNEITSLVGSAPGMLNTLGEIASYITDTSNSVGQILGNLNLKANVNNPTFTGELNVSGVKVDASGKLYVSGNNAYFDKDVIVNQDIAITRNAYIDGSLYSNNGVTIGDRDLGNGVTLNVDPESNILNVTGLTQGDSPESFQIGVNVNGNLDVSGNLRVNGLPVATEDYVHNEITSLVANAPGMLNTLGEIAEYITDTSNSVGQILGNLNLKANVNNPTFTGELNVSGMTVDSSGKLYVSGNSYFDKDVIVNQDVSILRNAYVEGSLYSNNGVTIGDRDLGNGVTLNVDPESNILNVTGLTQGDSPESFQIGVNVNGNLDVSGNLRVNGLLVATEDYVHNEINNLVSNAPGMLNTLGEIASYITDTSNSVGQLLGTMATKANLSGARFTGSVDVSGSLRAGTLDVSGNTKLYGRTDIYGTLQCSGTNSIFRSVIADNLYSIGSASLSSDLLVVGNTKMHKNLDVSGNIHASSLDVSGFSRFYGPVAMTGIVSASSLAAGTLSASAGIIVNNGMLISGNATFRNGNVDISGNLRVKGIPVATEDYVNNSLTSKANVVSPAFTGGMSVSGMTVDSAGRLIVRNDSSLEDVIVNKDISILGSAYVQSSLYCDGGLIVGDGVLGNGVSLLVDPDSTVLNVTGLTQGESPETFQIGVNVNGNLTVGGLNVATEEYVDNSLTSKANITDLQLKANVNNPTFTGELNVSGMTVDSSGKLYVSGDNVYFDKDLLVNQDVSILRNAYVDGSLVANGGLTIGDGISFLVQPESTVLQITGLTQEEFPTAFPIDVNVNGNVDVSGNLRVNGLPVATTTFVYDQLINTESALYKSDDTLLTSNSSTLYPTQRAVKGYVDTALFNKADLLNPVFVANVDVSGGLQVEGGINVNTNATITIGDKTITHDLLSKLISFASQHIDSNGAFIPPNP